jgi:hypothetical protein
LWPHPTPDGHDFNKLAFVFNISESVHINLSFSGPAVLEKKILKIFPYIDTCKNCFPNFCPTRPLGTKFFINLNLHFVRRLLSKSEVSGFVVLVEKIFKMTHHIFALL